MGVVKQCIHKLVLSYYDYINPISIIYGFYRFIKRLSYNFQQNLFQIIWHKTSTSSHTPLQSFYLIKIYLNVYHPIWPNWHAFILMNSPNERYVGGSLETVFIYLL